jgi:predicted O-methyltransferase YrrM
MKSMKIIQDESILIKSGKNYCRKINDYLIKNIFKFLMMFLFLFLIITQKKIINELKKHETFFNENNCDKSKNDLKYKYHLYEREVITEKMKKYAGWLMKSKEPYFINGIIRRHKPKKCLEIGVAFGGSSIIILNAIKDIKDSFLVSLDLNSVILGKQTGYNAKKYFPELTNNNKWKLFTGKQPHKFLDKLNIKFDFLFLDTAHLVPGEIINLIEALPFLEENAIIVLHDIMYHLQSKKYGYRPIEIKFHPAPIYLFTSLAGYKIIMKEDENKGVENIGAVFLHSNKEKYYLNYFLLLLSQWEYMPPKNQIEELRAFIIKYYKNETLLFLFDKGVEENKIYINKFKKFKSIYKKCFKN